MFICCGFYELAGDPHATTGFPNASLQHIANPKLPPNPFNVHRLAFVGETGIARDDEQRLEPRQFSNDVLGYAVREILLLWITTHVLERQYRDGRYVGQDRRLLVPGGYPHNILRS